jgi:hypothetical protein
MASTPLIAALKGLAMPLRHTRSLTLARLSSVSKATLRHSQARALALPIAYRDSQFVYLGAV